MTSYPNTQYDTSIYKFKLIEKITQLDDLKLILQLAEQLSIDLYTTDVEGIRRTPEVVGGSARIRDTRIPVWVLVDYKNLGKDNNWFLANYPGLTEKDLLHAWKYYALHKEEIDEDIRKNDED